MNKIIRIVDFETSGGDENAAIEAGWTDLDLETMTVSAPNAVFIKTEAPISPSARGVHHITDEEIATGMELSQALERLRTADPGSHIVAFCAHNIDTDAKLMDAGDIPWICTYKSSYTAWPDAPDYKNQTLRYWLDKNNQIDRAMALPAHRAGPDSYVTAWLLRHLFQVYDMEQMIEITQNPLLLHTVPIGKEKGKAWKDIDAGYLKWLLQQDWLDESLRYTAEKEAARRRALLAERNNLAAALHAALPKQEIRLDHTSKQDPTSETLPVPTGQAEGERAQSSNLASKPIYGNPMGRIGFRKPATSTLNQKPNGVSDPEP